MRACLLILVAPACSDPIGAGEASSAALPQIASAYAEVGNVFLDQPQAGTYRVWHLGFGAEAAGTDCTTVDPIISFEVYTIFSSAPRGDIPISMLAPPPQEFPTLYAEIADGTFSAGTLSITSASTTRLIGTFTGFANLAGQPSTSIDLAFTAPTCAQ